MHKHLLISLLVAYATPTELIAHGGIYRGPGDVVPPNPGGGRGTAGGSPGPGGPNTPGPSIPGLTPPGTGQPGGPVSGGFGPGNPGGSAATSGRGGVEVPDDLTRWSFWWEFNKERFINLRDALAAGRPTTSSEDIYYGGAIRDAVAETLRPTRTHVINEVLPALQRALAGTQNRDITSACMVAMAKIGADHSSFRILPLLEERLRDKDQEIRETAALALGISQMPDALPTLLDLLADSPRGRASVARSEVDPRTRAFAAYGLGLIAHASSNLDLKAKVSEALRQALTTSSDRNIKVSAIHAMRQIRLNGTHEAEVNLRNQVLDTLWTYYTKDSGQGEQQIQAHVPVAIATLLGRGGDPTGKFRNRLLDELADKFGKRHINLYQSAVLALGLLCTPEDREARSALESYAASGRDQQARHFALIALAQIGGNEHRTTLLGCLAKGTDQERSWAALALGVFCFTALEKSKDTSVDTTVGRALLDVLRTEKNPEVTTAAAIGLGLARYQDGADDLRKLLVKYRKDDERAGYFALGLALMNDQASKAVLRELVKTSTRRPSLMRQAAVALGKLGDPTVAPELTAMLNDGAPNVAKLSAIAAALSFIGDRRSIKPLVGMLFDTALTELSRAFVAAALGGIADKEPLPWNTKIGADINYRAAVETLTNQSSGVLDIL